MGVECVPVLAKVYTHDNGDGHAIFSIFGSNHEAYGGGCVMADFGKSIIKIAEDYYDGPDPIGKTHVREGVVVRIVNRPKFTAYKHKNFFFKVIEGIAKDTATAPDMEEAEEVVEDEVSIS